MGSMLKSAAAEPAFDPEGDGYDMTAARQAGLAPAGSEAGENAGHWPSRVPDTGMLLKGRTHKTFDVGVKADADLGYKLIKKNGRYYTVKDDE